MSKSSLSTTMRVYHRYLGFFLAGIMAMYAISGVLLIFRETEFLKSEKIKNKVLDSHVKTEELGKALRIREFKVEKEDANFIYFKQGTFNKNSKEAQYKVKELPFILEKMTKLHKASTNQPLFFLNVFFGLSLLFFVISSFCMFMPKTTIFKKGIYFALAGFVLVLILLFV